MHASNPAATERSLSQLEFSVLAFAVLICAISITAMVAFPELSQMRVVWQMWFAPMSVALMVYIVEMVVHSKSAHVQQAITQKPTGSA